MKVATPFEIKIAVIGYVSVGKTTVLNALFRDKYGEVAMRRTTAGVNYFRLSSPKSEDTEDDTVSKERTWSMTVDDPRTAESTLEEITADNAILRESDKVQEKTFDIELKDELCEMRNDTKLVVVDIPGINEAGASSKYREYVSEKWHTFDCVIVVMDGRQGVNTDEQVNLLKFVQEKRSQIKEVPTIILCNKVDDPDDEEQQVLVDEAQQVVESIFKVNDRDSALNQILHKEKPEEPYPAFIPVSAIHGFIYQSTSVMSFDQFKNFDKNLVEKLGKENLGNKWKRLKQDEKLTKAFEVVNDPELCREGLELSNFDKFLKVLSCAVGGKANQLSLITKQIDIASSRLSPDNCLADELQIILDRCRALDMPTDKLASSFWSAYQVCETTAFQKFLAPDKVAVLSNPMKQLTAYHSFVKKAGWKAEEDEVVNRMKQLIRRQFGVLFEQKAAWTFDGFRKASKVGEIGWATLSPKGWQTIFDSILIATQDRLCLDHFGQEKIWLEDGVRECSKQAVGAPSGSLCPLCWNATTPRYGADFCGSCILYFNPVCNKGNCAKCKYNSNQALPFGDGVHSCNHCASGRSASKEFPGDVDACSRIKFVDGRLEPVYPDAYKGIVGIDIPTNGPSDPGHFGHLVWEFCRILEPVR